MKEHLVLEKTEPLVKENSIFIKVGNILEKISMDDINWIQSDGNYCYIFTKERRFVVKRSLVKVFDFLPRDSFLRIHMRYVVGKNKINRIDLGNNLVHIQDKELAIGPKFRSELLAALNII